MVRSACAALLFLLAIRPAAAEDPDALWKIISQQCVPNEREYGQPKPCVKVDLTGEYVVLKDRSGATQFLVMPTDRVTGIEDPAILAPNAPNYWEDAWQARSYVDELSHRTMPRDTISLAINSVDGRTQNQLHIHVDCVRPDVRSALHDHASAISATWTKFPEPLAGHDYMAMRIAAPDLTHSNPFDLLANALPGAKADMGHYTLVVVGLTDGFALLAGHASGLTDRGSGEELQDHTCALAH
jgi:CDP-diacylglycerol pyrophosphatase